MKVLIINGSSHFNGCTARALKEVAKTLEVENIETETITLGRKEIKGCIGCQKCKKTSKCIYEDLVNKVATKFKTADGLIIGSPVYYAGMNGTLKAFLDRLFYSTNFNKSMKVGAAVVSSRRAGSTSAFDEINKYFMISNMPVVSSNYWNEVHGSKAKDVEKDLEGLRTMRNLGKNMAFLIKSIEIGKKVHGLPKLEKGKLTNFCDGL